MPVVVVYVVAVYVVAVWVKVMVWGFFFWRQSSLSDLIWALQRYSEDSHSGLGFLLHFWCSAVSSLSG